MIGFALYYILFSNEEAKTDEDSLWVLVHAEGYSAAAATSLDMIVVAAVHLGFLWLASAL